MPKTKAHDPRLKLTLRVVNAAPVGDSPYFIWDGHLKGFGLRVFPSGKRVYYADYRNASGARKRMALGAHGKITPDEARDLAVAALGDAVKGGDPALERATRRSSLTVKELCADYEAACDKGLIMGKNGLPKKKSTLDIDRGRIKRHIVPLLGSRLVIDLTPPDVARFIRDVQSGKTATVEKTSAPRGKAIVKGGPGTAARTVGFLGGILTYAVEEGVIATNPAHGVRRPAYKRRTRRLTPEEFRRLGKALDELEAEGMTRQAIDAVWLLALSGARSSEVVNLRWSEVDAPGGAIRWEDTKEGASTRPAGGPFFDRLARVDRQEECAYVLPPARKKEGAYGGLPSAVDKIMARAKLEGVTCHTLRHSFASVAGDLGYSEATIGAIIGHAGGSTTTSRYVHALDAVLVDAADKTARAVMAQMSEEVAGTARRG
jgi:integrase